MLLGTSIAMLLTVAAPGLEWDADPITPGVQGGSGDWNTGSVWWDEGKNVTWTDGQPAIFGGTPGVIDAGGITVGDITFNSNYTLQEGMSSGFLNFGSPGTVKITVAGSESRISLRIASLSGAASLRKDGAGTLILSGKNSYGGSTFIDTGRLSVVGGDAIPDTSDVTIKSGASLQLLASETIKSLSSSGDIELGGTLLISGAGPSSISGTINGSGSLFRFGGYLALENPNNTFKGNVKIWDGTLSVPTLTNQGTPSYLGAGNSLTLSASDLEITGSGIHSSDRSLILGGYVSISLPAGASLTQEIKNISGSGRLTLGGGTHILNGVSDSFTGDISVRGGVLQTNVLADSGVASGLGAGKLISLGNSASGSIGELFVPIVTDSLTNREILIEDGGEGRIHIAGGTLRLNGSIIGNGKLILTGHSSQDSTFVIGGAASGVDVISLERVKVQIANGGFPEDVQIEFGENQGGWLLLDRPATIGSLSGGGGNDHGRITVNDTLSTGGTFAGVIDGAGSVSNGGGNLTLLGANTFTGTMTVGGGGAVSVPSVENAGIASPLGAGSTVVLYAQFSYPNTARSLLHFSGSASDSTNRTLIVTGNGGIDVSSATGTLIWSGPINGDTSANLIKEGVGTFRMAGANGFAGAVDIREGRVQIIGGNALPNAGIVNIEAGATLELLPGGSETIGGLQGAGNLSLGGQRLIAGENNLSTTFTGKIIGNGSSQLIKRGSGTFTLTNLDSSDFSGSISIFDGAISAPSLGGSGAITLGDNEHIGRIILTNTGEAEMNRPVSVASGGGAIDIANVGAEVAIRSPLEGAGSLLKLGSGRLRIVGDKNYGGPVVVGDGVLDLDGDLPSSMTVLAPATLETSGIGARTIDGLTLAGGTLSLGGAEAVGALNTSSVILDSGNLELNINGTLLGHDHINATGAVLIDGLITLLITLGADPVDFVDFYRLIVNDGTDPTVQSSGSGRFAYQGNVLEEGEIFLVTSGDQSQYFEMRYGLTPEDNDVRIVAAPEPGVVSMLSCGLLCLFGGRRRRRHPSLRDI